MTGSTPPNRRRIALAAVGVGVLGIGSVVVLAGGNFRQDDGRAPGAGWMTGQLSGIATTSPPTISSPTTATTSPVAPDPTATTRAEPAPVVPRRTAATPDRPKPSSLASAWIAAGAQNVAADAAPASPAPVGERAPVRLVIPSIGVSAPIDPAGLNGDRTMQVPEDFARTNWYTGFPAPGDPGPAVIVGHVDNRTGPAVFKRLRDLSPGNEVIVQRADGRHVVFVVELTKQVPKSAFPTDEVYGPTPDPQLRLVTCGGTFDRSSRHYRDNIIVFLRLKA